MPITKVFEYSDTLPQGKTARTASPGDVSSLLSPWLTLGCLSLRQVYWEVIEHQQDGNSQYAGALLLDLLWRDYFRFMFKKHGQKFIAVKADSDKEIAANQDELFENWKNGSTGVALIDAIMHQLNATGFINNYSRQITAGFLINNLNVYWMKGAAYFEEKLVDYSPASNWGNWAFIAGINDARESKYTIAAKTMAELNVNNDYVNTWLPATAGTDLPAVDVK